MECQLSVVTKSEQTVVIVIDEEELPILKVRSWVVFSVTISEEHGVLNELVDSTISPKVNIITCNLPNIEMFPLLCLEFLLSVLRVIFKVGPL